MKTSRYINISQACDICVNTNNGNNDISTNNIT